MRGKRGDKRPSRSGDRFRPKRRLSQNFLHDQNVAAQIVHLSQIRPADTVIEVGPGKGALTGHLVAAARHVHAVELDRKLFDRLGVEYGAEERLSLHHGDILEVAIRDLVKDEKVVVVGNLPYSITSDLVLWLLRQHTVIRRAVVLMQKEVAERLTAEPGTRKAGSLTLAVGYRAEAERILDVSPGSFHPRPRVTSSLVAFRFRDRPAVTPRDEAYFFRVIRAGFGERRKTLVNSLSSGLPIPRSVIESAVEATGLPPRVRGERLTLDDFCRLADHLMARTAPPGGRTGNAESAKEVEDI